MVDISRLLTVERIVTLKEDCDKDAALSRLVDVLAKTREVTDKAELSRAITDRERILSTGVGGGIAIPHAKVPSVKRFVAAIGISKKGVPFQSQDKKPAHVIVMIAGPENQSEEYIKILARFTAILRKENTVKKILQADGPKAVLGFFESEKVDGT